MPRTDDAGCLRRALRHRLDNLTDGLKSTYLMAHADSVLIEDEEPEASDLEVIAEESNEIRLSPLEPPPRNRTRAYALRDSILGCMGISGGAPTCSLGAREWVGARCCARGLLPALLPDSRTRSVS